MYLPAHKDSRGGHNRIPINHQFFKKWTPKMSYVLGMIYSDGAIHDVQESSRACYLTIASKDKSLLDDIRRAMSSSHQLYKQDSSVQLFPGNKVYATHEIFRLRIGSKVIYNDLLSLGVTPRKSLTISFPEIPSNFLSFFIRGYFDGDGCLHLKEGRYPRLIFTSGSRRFLEDLAECLIKFLLISSYSISTQLTGKNPCYRLYYNATSSKKILQFMYKDLNSAPYLKRKYKIYASYLMQNQKLNL